MTKNFAIGLFILIFLGAAYWMFSTRQASEMSAKAEALSKEYEATLKHSEASVPYHSQFKALFPDSIIYFSYFANPAMTPILQGDGFLYGRYEISMSVDVEIDHDTRQVRRYGEPSFMLLEVSEVEQLSDGRYSVSYNVSSERSFDKNEWQRLVESGGDFSLLGLDLIMDQPIEGFEGYQKDALQP